MKPLTLSSTALPVARRVRLPRLRYFSAEPFAISLCGGPAFAAGPLLHIIPQPRPWPTVSRKCAARQRHTQSGARLGHQSRCADCSPGRSPSRPKWRAALLPLARPLRRLRRRLIEPERTSPIAKIPRRLVSSGLRVSLHAGEDIVGSRPTDRLNACPGNGRENVIVDVVTLGYPAGR